ncbi:hypothetical protein GCM10008959_25580 [Deinococcus seoulensis]|uniref:DUF5666 domain-containing protein n=1 Tax=Deinococcus seoulensis TaxID=1837379 RepID=A0ABQ2RWX4_9DEIO|nr:hypothetical protein [Deinococcus seoulensis]GGR62471.1 hypothetical protein GCM10008959_25580 [Deinococcus seoulensis]
MTPASPIPHAAVITVTGWPTVLPDGIRIHGLHVRTAWRPGETPQRVTVRAFPDTSPHGGLRRLYAPPSNIRPARRPNGTDVLVTGQLLKLDTVEGLIRVKVAPAVANTHPFTVTLQASTEVLRLDPGTFSVTVRGRVLSVGPGVLLADQVRSVYAPVPERWQGVRAYTRRVGTAPPAEPPVAAD